MHLKSNFTKYHWGYSIYHIWKVPYVYWPKFNNHIIARVHASLLSAYLLKYIFGILPACVNTVLHSLNTTNSIYTYVNQWKNETSKDSSAFILSFKDYLL